jgi:hypothetical protein
MLRMSTEFSDSSPALKMKWKKAGPLRMRVHYQDDNVYG